MQLSELVADPALGLTLLTGSSDRVVHGVYITDLLDPRRYLRGGELVLTGLMWRTDPADSTEFVAALAEAGVAAVAAGTAWLGSTPDDLVEACRKHGIPLVEVPVALSFGTLSERVMAAHRAAGREWVSALAAGADLDEVLELAAAELGTGCWVVSGTGAVLAGTPGAPAHEELVHGLHDSNATSGTVRTTRGACRFHVVGGGADPRIAQWFVVLREASPEALAELATVVALVRSRVDQARNIAGRSVESALRRLLDGTSSATEVAARLDTVGLPAGEPLRVVQLSVTRERPGGSALAVTVLRELAAATGLPSVAAPLGEAAAAVFADDEGQLSTLPDRFREFAALAGSTARLCAGISDIGTADGLRSALEEAGHARRLAEHDPRSAVVTADALASHQVLLASVPEELRRSYRDKLLGPLIGYDEAHATDLLNTLRVFLECSGSWSRCAARLHLHVNTLRYRIGRIEQITGRELGNLAARVDFHLALQLIDDRQS
ncbi:PucR family transcriptional regulator [Saccharopolyspora gloriosae]|uniref:PucR family transcriptional regulator n=1 Tax=Saccharopolyspora gloriosae TaxID=455344 RepID=UPI001FB5F195|nr:PucR family transcriptional regulator [Saccharopolyspora gloriosae]